MFFFNNFQYFKNFLPKKEKKSEISDKLKYLCGEKAQSTQNKQTKNWSVLYFSARGNQKIFLSSHFPAKVLKTGIAIAF